MCAGGTVAVRSGSISSGSSTYTRGEVNPLEIKRGVRPRLSIIKQVQILPQSGRGENGGEMLGYQCRYCGVVKFPDGKGCQCGASYGSLNVVRLKPGLRAEKDYEYYGERNPRRRGQTK